LRTQADIVAGAGIRCRPGPVRWVADATGL